MDLGDGTTRTFYGRTESHAISPHRVESGDTFVHELRPPRADGYTLVVAVAPAEDELPGNRSAGTYAYMYADTEPQQDADGGAPLAGGGEMVPVDAGIPGR